MKNKQLILGAIVGAAIIYLLSSMVIDNKLESLKTHLDEKINSHIISAENIAKIIGRGGEVSEEIALTIPECPANEMSQYDSLLSSLDKGLSKYELQGLNILFKRCGDKFASRRAGMVLLFEYEILNLSELISEREILGDYSVLDTNLEKWEALVKEEKEVSRLYFELVNAQRQIISILADEGESISTVEEIQSEVARIKSEMTVATTKTFELRESLISL